MILYHATPMENLGSIMQDGLILGVDHVVYGCEKPKDALKFAFLHGVDDVLVVKFKVSRKCVVETFDHSEMIFKCRCRGSTVPIAPDMIVEYRKHDLRPFRQRLYNLNK